MTRYARLGINLPSIGVSVRWWVGAARRAESVGLEGAWCWDHFVSRGRLTDPVVEAWTTLTATAATTERILVGTFVANVMNRQPAVLARMAATLQELSGGRLVLGIGIGGHPAEHRAYGIAFPPPAERAARLEEAVAVLRALWTGGPVTLEGRFYALTDAHAFPVPRPAPPIVIGGETRAGARLAARIGDGWTAFETFERDLPIFEEALAVAGRARAEVETYAAIGLESPGSGRDPWLDDPLAELARWRERGADHVILAPRRAAQVDPLLEALARA